MLISAHGINANEDAGITGRFVVHKSSAPLPFTQHFIVFEVNIMTAYFALLQSTGHRKLLFHLYIKSRYYVCLIYSVKTYVAQHNYLLVYASNVTSVSLPQESILFLFLLTIKPMQNDKFPVEEHAVTQITDLFSR